MLVLCAVINQKIYFKSKTNKQTNLKKKNTDIVECKPLILSHQLTDTSSKLLCEILERRCVTVHRGKHAKRLVASTRSPNSAGVCLFVYICVCLCVVCICVYILNLCAHCILCLFSVNFFFTTYTQNIIFCTAEVVIDSEIIRGDFFCYSIGSQPRTDLGIYM